MSSKQKKGMVRFGQAATGVTTHGPFRVNADGSLGIDFSKLDTPSKLYDADTSTIERAAGCVRLLFGKQNLDDAGELLTRIEVKMPPEAFVRHFWGNSVAFFTSLEEQIQKWPQDPLQQRIVAKGLPAARSHSEWSNFAVMARSGGHGTIDFFYLPPLGLAQFARGLGVRNLTLVASVRVLLTVHEMYYLLSDARDVAEEVKQYLPAEV